MPVVEVTIKRIHPLRWISVRGYQEELVFRMKTEVNYGKVKREQVNSLNTYKFNFTLRGFLNGKYESSKHSKAVGNFNK